MFTAKIGDSAHPRDCVGDKKTAHVDSLQSLAFEGQLLYCALCTFRSRRIYCTLAWWICAMLRIDFTVSEESEQPFHYQP